MKKKVTSTDIAHAAGVSQSTVSMILNKKYDVSFAKETVEKVENAAKELGYVPPKRKTRKGTKREKLLVVFCPNLTNPYYVMLLQGIEAHAKEKGFGLFVCNTQRDLRMEERYLKMMWQLRPLGIIYTCNPSHCFMDLVGEIAEQIPVAIVNNQNEKMNVDAVELDNSKLGRVMAKHLLELGHRKVAYIAPPLTARQKQRSKRVEGFLKEYEKAGLRDQVIIKAAKEEGIEFHFLTAQKELVLENGKVTGLRCIKLREGAPEANGRRKLIEIPGTEFVIPCSNVISAIGQRIDQSIFEQKDNILFDKRGNISVTESLATSRPGVFAGGDCATGPTTLIGGMAQGQTAAESIHEYLTRGSVGFEPRSRMTQMIKKCNLLEETEPVLPTIHQDRQQMPELAPEIRAHNFEEVELGLTPEEAKKEAERCMRCYRLFGVVTQLPIPGFNQKAQ